MTIGTLTRIDNISQIGTYPAIECMQHGVTGPISDAASSVGLASFTIVQALTTKCTLVDLTIVHSTEWHSNVFQLTYSNSRDKYFGRLTCT